jgi:hypothetical protein
MRALLAGAVVAVVALAATEYRKVEQNEHTCKAPCMVKFSKTMQEDELYYDFTRYNNKPNLFVWKGPAQ